MGLWDPQNRDPRQKSPPRPRNGVLVWLIITPRRVGVLISGKYICKTGEAARGVAWQCGGGEAEALAASWQRGSPHRTHCAYAEEDDEVVGGEWAATMGVYSKGRW